jgi:hypothetical protein
MLRSSAEAHVVSHEIQLIFAFFYDKHTKGANYLFLFHLSLSSSTCCSNQWASTPRITGMRWNEEAFGCDVVGGFRVAKFMKFNKFYNLKI